MNRLFENQRDATKTAFFRGFINNIKKVYSIEDHEQFNSNNLN